MPTRKEIAQDFTRICNPDLENIALKQAWLKFTNDFAKKNVKTQNQIIHEDIVKEAEEDRTSAYPRKPKPAPTPETQPDKKLKKYDILILTIILLLLHRNAHPGPQTSKEDQQFSDRVNEALKYFQEQPEFNGLYENAKKFVEKKSHKEFKLYFNPKLTPQINSLSESLVELSNEQRFGVTEKGKLVPTTGAHDIANVIIPEKGTAIGNAPLKQIAEIIPNLLGTSHTQNPVTTPEPEPMANPATSMSKLTPEKN